MGGTLPDVRAVEHLLVQFDRKATLSDVLHDLKFHEDGAPWPNYNNEEEVFD